MTKEISVGKIKIGGGNPISVQSMTNTKTDDVEATVRQINALAEAGCDIVRVSVNTSAAAAAIKEIKRRITVPLVADIHFDAELAVASIENGVDKVRVNPSNIGDEKAIKAVVDAAKAHNIPLRVGVNGGSLEKDVVQKYGFGAEAIAESALKNVSLLEKLGFYNIVISAKCSDVMTNIRAYERISKAVSYPLHIGVTEAGGGDMALAKSYAGIGALLAQGIGDTVRVSITGEPVQEVIAARNLLRALGLQNDYVNVIACPTCARTEIDVLGLSEKVKELTKNIRKPYTVAVMGCVVNGVGEGSHADIGVAGGREKSAIFRKGEVIKTVKNDEILPTLAKLIEEDCIDR